MLFSRPCCLWSACFASALLLPLPPLCFCLALPLLWLLSLLLLLPLLLLLVCGTFLVGVAVRPTAPESSSL